MTLDARTYLWSISSLAVLCALGVACGDHDSDTYYSSGLQDDTAASQLDDDDKRQFCSTLDTHVNVTIGLDEIARIACLPRILFTASSRADCEAKLNECSSSSKITLEHEQRGNQCFSSLASCQDSVASLESCVNVNVAALRAVLENFTCARFGGNDLERDLQRAMDSAKGCAQASASCQDAVFLL